MMLSIFPAKHPYTMMLPPLCFIVGVILHQSSDICFFMLVLVHGLLSCLTIFWTLLIINVCILLPDASKFVVWFVFVFQAKVVRCTDASFNCLEIAPNEQMDLWRSIFF